MDTFRAVGIIKGSADKLICRMDLHFNVDLFTTLCFHRNIHDDPFFLTAFSEREGIFISKINDRIRLSYQDQIKEKNEGFFCFLP